MSTSESLKLCIDCGHCNKITRGELNGLYFCRSDNLFKKSLVDGSNILKVENTSCETLRVEGPWVCGTKARWFHPKAVDIPFIRSADGRKFKITNSEETRQLIRQLQGTQDEISLYTEKEIFWLSVKNNSMSNSLNFYEALKEYYEP